VTTFRIPLDDIKVLKPVPCGMDPYVLMSLVPLMRTTTEDHEPVLVRREGDGWRLVDGRHRWVAALMGGRQDILARDEETGEPVHIVPGDSVTDLAAVRERTSPAA
jgi:hypothetical protein